MIGERRSVLIASMPEAGFDFKTALANFKTKYGDEAYSKLRGVGNNTWSAFTDNVTQMYADGPPAHEKQSSGKPPTDDEKKMSVIVALEVAAAGHADGDCRQGVLLCGAVWLFGVLGGWVECGLGCRLGVGLAVGGGAYNEIDGGPLAQQASAHDGEGGILHVARCTQRRGILDARCAQRVAQHALLARHIG